MNTSKLIFFPDSIDKAINNEALLQTLINSQFITENKQNTNQYLPGDNFLSLITFLGCSPNINLIPVEGENHCFISLIEHSQKPICLGYTLTVNPKCPACKKRIGEWKIPDWQSAGQLCHCDKCQKQSLYSELNWKHECGFSRCGFEIHHIYPHEAVPTDQLLEKLKYCSGFEWDYCYTTN